MCPVDVNKKFKLFFSVVVRENPERDTIPSPQEIIND